MNNRFVPTDKLILTEDGLVQVFAKDSSLYIRNDSDGYVVYEVVSDEAVLDKEAALDTYPEAML